MKLFRHNRTETRISLLVNGKTLTFPVSERAANAIAAVADENQALRRDKARLETGAVQTQQAIDALGASQQKLRAEHQREHERQQRRIDNLVRDKHVLRANNDGLSDTIRQLDAALARKQAELDNAIAEVKRLDAKLIQADCENLRLGGELATAEEKLAGYEVKA